MSDLLVNYKKRLCSSKEVIKLLTGDQQVGCWLLLTGMVVIGQWPHRYL